MLASYESPESTDSDPPRWRPAVFEPGATRFPVSDRLLRMARFGLGCGEAASSGWWRRVEDEMQALVRAHLPGGVERVRMRLDTERMEVVLRYEGCVGRDVAVET